MRFIIPIVILSLTTNCKDVEYLHTAYYTYINKSSYDIELKVCRTERTDDVTTYNIPVGKQLTLYDVDGGGFPQRPFVLGDSLDSYIVVSNGATAIIQYLDNGTGLYTGLYDLGNYRQVRYEPSKTTSSIWYEYEFTDAFFEQDTTE